MTLLLVSTVLKYVNTGPKNSFLLDLIAKRRLKITLHVSSKNVVIAIKFIVAVAGLKAKIALSDTSKLPLASKKTIGHCKSNRLNVIYKSGVIINACSWRQYS